MNIKTKEPNPNLMERLRHQLFYLTKSTQTLTKLLTTLQHQKKKIELHIHPFIAAYLNQGFPSIRTQWFFKHKKRVKIIPRDAYQYLHYRFY